MTSDWLDRSTSISTPAWRRVSAKAAAANSLGVGTATVRNTRPPGGMLPLMLTLLVPLGPASTPLTSIWICEPFVAVRTLFTTVSLVCFGETSTDAGSPSAPGTNVTSIKLSFTTIGDITTSVPNSRWPSGNRLASTLICPLTFRIPAAATSLASARKTVSGSPDTTFAPGNAL